MDGRQCGGGGGARLLLAPGHTLPPFPSRPLDSRGGININYVSKGRLRPRTGYTSSRSVPGLREFTGMSSRLAFLLIVGTVGTYWLFLLRSRALSFRGF